MNCIFFYLFFFILLFSSIKIILNNNPIKAALYLIFSFFSFSGILILLNAQFLAIITILINIGAVMVLFLFTIMMLDLKKNKKKKIPFFIIIIFILEIIIILLNNKNFFLILEKNLHYKTINFLGTAKELGLIIYTKYIYIFEISSIILFLTIISIISISLKNKCKF